MKDFRRRRPLRPTADTKNVQIMERPGFSAMRADYGLLTPRGREVMTLMVAGLRNKQAAVNWAWRYWLRLNRKRPNRIWPYPDLDERLPKGGSNDDPIPRRRKIPHLSEYHA